MNTIQVGKIDVIKGTYITDEGETALLASHPHVVIYTSHLGSWNDDREILVGEIGNLKKRVAQYTDEKDALQKKLTERAIKYPPYELSQLHPSYRLNAVDTGNLEYVKAYCEYMRSQDPNFQYISRSGMIMEKQDLEEDIRQLGHQMLQLLKYGNMLRGLDIPEKLDASSTTSSQKEDGAGIQSLVEEVDEQEDVLANTKKIAVEDNKYLIAVVLLLIALFAGRYLY